MTPSILCNGLNNTEHTAAREVERGTQPVLTIATTTTTTTSTVATTYYYTISKRLQTM